MDGAKVQESEKNKEDEVVEWKEPRGGNKLSEEEDKKRGSLKFKS